MPRIKINDIPMIEEMTAQELNGIFGGALKRPTQLKTTPHYVVDVHEVASNKVRKKIEKRNLLTMKYLPPGSYR